MNFSKKLVIFGVFLEILVFFLVIFLIFSQKSPDCSLCPAGKIEITKVVNNTCVCEEVDCVSQIKQMKYDLEEIEGVLE